MMNRKNAARFTSFSTAMRVLIALLALCLLLLATSCSPQMPVATQFPEAAVSTTRAPAAEMSTEVIKEVEKTSTPAGKPQALTATPHAATFTTAPQATQPEATSPAVSPTPA